MDARSNARPFPFPPDITSNDPLPGSVNDLSDRQPATRLRPVIIVGAGRSGTNILRDLLVTLPRVGTWPCDEINYIWRHGNVRYPTDEFTADMARPEVVRYIQRQFHDIAVKTDSEYVVEKTCATSLRVRFVDRIFPEARYVFIVRNGRDVVASARERWRAPLDPRYILSKVRYVPPTDLPYYAARYVVNRLFRLFSHEKRLAFWGPQFEGMKEALRTRSLAEACALQWARCVRRAEADLALIPPDRVHRVRYEDLVTAPERHLAALARFLEIDASEDRIRDAARRVSPRSVGTWKDRLLPDQWHRVEEIVAPLLPEYGY